MRSCPASPLTRLPRRANHRSVGAAHLAAEPVASVDDERCEGSMAREIRLSETWVTVPAHGSWGVPVGRVRLPTVVLETRVEVRPLFTVSMATTISLLRSRSVLHGGGRRTRAGRITPRCPQGASRPRGRRDRRPAHRRRRSAAARRSRSGSGRSQDGEPGPPGRDADTELALLQGGRAASRDESGLR